MGGYQYRTYLMLLVEEDTLRLNVLAAAALAIRIDEDAMCVEALTAATTHRVDLKPAGNPVRYLRAVRESLSVLALGTPGGYPVFIRRWTRSGALETDRLTRLLCLGEPEAVVAVAASPNLDDELARRAWWCLPTAEVARLMLAHPAVANGSTGPTLGHFLLDHLPFETASRPIIDTVKLLLRSHLLNDQEIGRLWAQTQDHVAWLVGFLSAGPQYLDVPCETETNAHTASFMGTGPMETLLARTDSAQGRHFLRCVESALKQAIDMDTVVDTLNALGDYCKPLRGEEELPRSADALQRAIAAFPVLSTETFAKDGTGAKTAAQLRQQQAALITLSLCGEPLVVPFFARSDAVGSLMRRKLEPLLSPVFFALDTLLNP